jgi:hypothetical protein
MPGRVAHRPRPRATAIFNPVAVSPSPSSFSSVLGDHGDVGVPGVGVSPDS